MIVAQIAQTFAEDSTSVGGLIMPTWVLWIIALSTIIVAVRTIWSKAIKPIVSGMRTIHATYERMEGYDDRIKSIETNTNQLTRNSGSHLADAIYRIETAQTEDRKILDAHVSDAKKQIAMGAEKEAAILAEISDVWKNLAARDTVKAALKTAETIERSESEGVKPDNDLRN